MEFEHEKILKGANFCVWSNTVENIMKKDNTNEEKLKSLTHMENDVNGILFKIRKEKKKIQKITNLKKEE